MIVAVLSTKGGSGKTTTAMHIAAGLGGDTLLIDADPQASALSWYSGDEVEVPFDLISTVKLDKTVPKLAEKFDHIVIDCPPGIMNIIGRAIRAAQHVVLTAQPTPADLDKLIEVDELVLEEQDDDGIPTLTVLLTRVIKRTTAQVEARQIIQNNELGLFDAEIYNKQAIAMSHGASISANSLHGYEEVVAELKKLHEENFS